MPKSTLHVVPGQFWSIPRDDGAFGVGVVLGVPTAATAPHHATSSRTVVLGLLNKVSAIPASVDSLGGSELADWGFAHVRCIEMTSAGVGLAGIIDIPLGDVLMVSHRGGGSVGLYSNGCLVREATREEARSLPVYGTWGLTFIQRLASALT